LKLFTVWAGVIAMVAATLPAAPAFADAPWPQKPVRIVVAAPAGSSVDIVARVVAESLREKWGQAVIVENKAAAGGTAAAAEVAKSAPDGYTLFLGFNGPLANAPFLYSKLAYDPQKDFAPVVLTGSQPNLLAVHSGVEAGDLAALAALAKAQPGKLNYASVGNGSVSHLSMELLKRNLAIDLTHIPFNGGPPATQAVAAGEVQAIFSAPSNLLAQIKAGRLKPIAVTSAKRFRALPDVPTVAESRLPGVAGFESIAWNGLVAPAATPRGVIEIVNRDVNATLAQPAVAKKLLDAGIEAGGGTSAEFGALIASEAKKWGEVIRLTGAKVD
jgi:tripartite-type tricarboxylate transporter receptor subunit TctC